MKAKTLFTMLFICILLFSLFNVLIISDNPRKLENRKQMIPIVYEFHDLSFLKQCGIKSYGDINNKQSKFIYCYIEDKKNIGFSGFSERLINGGWKRISNEKSCVRFTKNNMDISITRQIDENLDADGNTYVFVIGSNVPDKYDKKVFSDDFFAKNYGDRILHSFLDIELPGPQFANVKDDQFLYISRGGSDARISAMINFRDIDYKKLDEIMFVNSYKSYKLLASDINENIIRRYNDSNEVLIVLKQDTNKVVCYIKQKYPEEIKDKKY